MKAMLKKVINKTKKIYKNYAINKIMKKYLRKHKRQIESVNLTEEQINEIFDIWEKNYGKKIDLRWHKLYTSYMGIFNKYYFPEFYFIKYLLPILNPSLRKKYLSDKVLIQYFFNDIEEKYKVILPELVLYKSNGFYYSSFGLIRRLDAVKLLKNKGELIIKPSIDTNSGDGVSLINIVGDVDELSGKTIDEIFDDYRDNFVVQKKIIQNKQFSRLNSSSVNTIRVNTYICDDKVYCSPVAMRIGRSGKVVDNAHAGGIHIGVTDDGKLMKYAFTEMGNKFSKHPDSKVVFENYFIPKIKEIKKFAIDNHYRIPHMGIIAWDFTVDNNDKIVLIEANISCPSIWLNQYPTGQAFFGDNTEKMINLIRKKDNYEK